MQFTLSVFQKAIPTIFYHVQHLTRFTSQQALEAIVQPVKQAGWDIDITMVEAMVLPLLSSPTPQEVLRSVDQESVIDPPLLAIVCHKLSQNAMQARRTTISEEDYLAVGDVRTIITDYLEEVLRQFGGRKQHQVRTVLKTFVLNASLGGSLEDLRPGLPDEDMPLATLEDLLEQLRKARLVRMTASAGQTRYELLHQYLAEPIAAWIEEYEQERAMVLKTIQDQYPFYERYKCLLSPEILVLYEKHREELRSRLLPEWRDYVDVSTKERHETQARTEKITRASERALLMAVVSSVGGALGALTRMGLSWIFGSFIYLPGIPTTLSAWVNPAWQGLFGTVIGGLLVVWVLEMLFRDHRKSPLHYFSGFVISGMLWGVGMSTVVASAFRPESLALLGWGPHWWGYPITGTCWGVGLALGMFVGTRSCVKAPDGVGGWRHRYWGGLCGAVCCLLLSPWLLKLVFMEHIDMRRAWGEALEQSLSVWAVWRCYYRHPLVAKRWSVAIRRLQSRSATVEAR